MMEYHGNLQTTLISEDSDSDENSPAGKILKEEEIVGKEVQMRELSSKEDEDSLDIKPPQTSSRVKSRSHHKSKKKRRHIREHKSRSHHQSHSDRNSHRDRKDGYSTKSRPDYNKTIERKHQSKAVMKDDEVKEIKDVRHIRLIKDFKDSREDKATTNKYKEDGQLLDQKKLEWRKKRLLWIKHQRELTKDQGEASWFQRVPDHYKQDHMDYENRKEDLSESDQMSDQDDVDTDSDINDSESDLASGSESSHSSVNKEDNCDTSEKENEKTKSAEGKEAVADEMKHKKEENSSQKADETSVSKLPAYLPAIQGSRSIDRFHVLNRIEEGTYGVVYRARDKETNEIVALKRLKMEREKEGFPITSLREINTLLKAQHPNIVTVREIVVGSNMDRIYIAMDYVEHDLKSLMKTMSRPFLIGEVKTLLMQLLCAVAHLHDNWILHRDLKTSNLLLSHKGILKVGDFGLAREYGSPLKSYTPVVVTLWYRAPELLLGSKKYSTPIDMWSVGCVFGELLTMNALFPGKSEHDQINRIFKDLGTPTERIWPGVSELPIIRSLHIHQHPYNNLKSRFSDSFSNLGFDLLNRFLTYDPSKRISAEAAKKHEYFNEKPRPVPPNMFPTWPAKSEQGHKLNITAQSSPKPPSGGKQYQRLMEEADDGFMSSASFQASRAQHKHSDKSSGFSLKF